LRTCSTFLEELGRGAYGLVLKVEANDTNELFAAKIVNKKALKRIRVGRFGNALQSVKKELSIWRKFKHRHIVVLREVIDTDGELASARADASTEELTRVVVLLVFADSDELFMISELVEGGPVLDGETYVGLAPKGWQDARLDKLTRVPMQ
jgi:serine/threonine protein kinase